MIKSEICEMLGITYPVFQGGMAWIADGKLAAAVYGGNRGLPGGKGLGDASLCQRQCVRIFWIYTGRMASDDAEKSADPGFCLPWADQL